MPEDDEYSDEVNNGMIEGEYDDEDYGTIIATQKMKTQRRRTIMRTRKRTIVRTRTMTGPMH